MDDTPARMKKREDLAGRSAEEIVGRESGTAPGPAGTGEFAAPGVTTRSYAPPAAGDSDRRTEETDDSDRRTREIRAEIEQTREEMSETIEAIQERIRPRNLVSDAADRVRHSAKEKVTSMAQKAGRRAHAMMNQAEDMGRSKGGTPQAIPLALIGVGAAWMLWNRAQGARRRSNHAEDWPDRRGYGGTWGSGMQYGRPDRETYGAYGETEIYGGGGYREYNRSGGDSGLLQRITSNPIPAALASAGLAWLAFSPASDEGEWYDSEDLYRGSMGSYADAQEADSESGVGQMASHAMDSARGAMSRAQEETRHLAHRAQEYVSGTRHRARRRGRGVQSEVRHLVDTNPLLMGAGAFMLGAAIGLVVPETEREHEWMGETRDQMLEGAQERAREMAKNTVEEVKHAAGEAVGRIASEVVGGSGQPESGPTSDRPKA